MFVLFMHVRRHELTPDLTQMIDELQVRHGDAVDSILDKFEFRTHQILFHESYHFWQGLRLPFLYRYAFLSFIKGWQAFRNLATSEPDYLKWSCFLPEFNRLDLKARIGFMPGGRIFWSGEDAKLPPETVNQLLVSPLDLLECATSLAEFQVCTPQEQRADPTTLRRWRKRNPAYLDPFFFAAQFLESEELALRVLLPLINASFSTSEPSRGFVELLARVWGNFVAKTDFSESFLAQPEPCRWNEIFQMFLDKMQFEAPPDSSYDILGTPFMRLSLKRVISSRLTSGNDFTVHPFLGPLAKRWIEEEEDNPQIAWLMDFPGWVTEESFRHARKTYSPPVTVLRFHLPNGGSRVLLWGSADLEGFSSTLPNDPSTWRGYIADYLAMFGVVRRSSGSHFDENQRTCHHVACPHFEANFCNAYPIVPKDYSVCGFPARIADLIQTFRSM